MHVWAIHARLMRTFCIGFLGADWWGSDARAMALELRRRGHLVLERHYEDHFPTRWRHPLLRLLRRLLRGLMARDYNNGVEELLAVGELDLMLVFKGMLLQPGTLNRFKRAGTPCFCFYPDVSFQDHGDNIPECLSLYDVVFTSKRYHLEDRGLDGEGADWCFAPHGFDPEVHRPVLGEGMAEGCYASDVSFAGDWSAKKQFLLEQLVGALPEIGLKIWGPGWGRACPEVLRFWQGRAAYGDELAAIYSLSKINLGLLSEAGRGTSQGDATTARTWQIPGAGGFLLHEDTAEIREAFAVGREVALFANGAELSREVTRYLGDEPLRQSVAAAGHQRAMSEPYTYARAVDIILERLASHQLEKQAKGGASAAR